MNDTPVLQSVCNLCGGDLPADTQGNTCTACVNAIGSVHIIRDDPIRAQPSRPDSAVLRSPANFGDYEILSELAHGGMGVVYVARQISLNRQVALKMILTPLAGASARRRFQAEAEHAATLEHPNIIPIYDSGAVDGLPYFTMKLIQGRPLSAEIRKNVSNPRRSIRTLVDIARAVHFAHQRGILHRDLKPANILIDQQGVPFVGDFGISKRVQTGNSETAVKLTRDGVAVGTPCYMSPEQASGNSRSVTTATDIYSLGAILYEMLTLRAPFQNTAHWEILLKVATEDPPSPRELRPNADRDLETICMKCLDKNPAKRYHSAEALALELERWLRGEPINARRHSPIERAVKWARRRPAAACIAGLILLLVCAMAGFYWRSGELLRRAETEKLEERRQAALAAVTDGKRLLNAARVGALDNKSVESESALVEAEDRFREALFNQRGDAEAEGGLREAALMGFETSLRLRNWRQAREKLLLARGAKLDRAEFEKKDSLLKRLESERGNQIRTRVTALMNDAASLTRTVTHELALPEIIAMKDPVTVELLKTYVPHERPECRMLACAALAWIGDESAVPLVLPYIQPKTPKGMENPLGVQQAALSAVCKLATNGDMETYAAVRVRIDDEPGDKSSVLFNGIKLQFEEFALRQSRRNASLKNGTPEDMLHYAEQLSDSKSYREVLEVLDPLVAQYPERIAYRNLRGLTRIEVDDLSGALADFNEIVKRMPEKRIGYINRGRACFHMRDLEGALSDFNMALKIDPSDPTVWTTRGLVKADLGDYKGALEDHDHALQLNSDELFALCNRAHVRHGLKDYKGALADYDRALSLSPLFMQALGGRACTRFELHDVEGSIADFDKALALDPNQPHWLFNRAVMKKVKGDLDGSIKDYDGAIKLDPKYATAYYNRGVLKEMTHDAEGAAADYQKSIDFDPKRAEAMVNLGHIREEAGDLPAAMALYSHAIETNPRVIEAWNSRADGNFMQGNFEQAVKDTKEAIKLISPADTLRQQAFEAQLKAYEAKAAKKSP